VAGLAALALAVNLTSPSGQVSFELTRTAAGALVYTIRLGRDVVVEPSSIGIVVDGASLGDGAAIGGAESYTVDERYPWYGVHSTATNRCRGLQVALKHAATGTAWTLDARACDDGAAFRYIVPGAASVRRTPDEATVFRWPAGAVVWSHDFEGHYEGVHVKRDVADVPAGDWAAAPLTVVIAYEYACPWCNRQRQAFTALREAYGDDVRIVFRPFVVHPEVATDAALAACAADRQGHFAEVSDALWSNVFDKRAFDRGSVEKAAAGVAGVDLARLRADMDGDCRGWIEREAGALSELGVNATPQVWINGRPIPGGYKPLEGLKPVLDEELARARERIAAGTPRDRYYADWVMKTGLTKVASN
jgi:protein-disulfide isomerase